MTTVVEQNRGNHRNSNLCSKAWFIRSFRQNSEDIFFLWGVSLVRMNWNFARLDEILNQTADENFSFLSWKTKKFYSKKKYFLSRCQYQNKKALFTNPIFSESFAYKAKNSPFEFFLFQLKNKRQFLQTMSVIDFFGKF